MIPQDAWGAVASRGYLHGGKPANRCIGVMAKAGFPYFYVIVKPGLNPQVATYDLAGNQYNISPQYSWLTRIRCGLKTPTTCVAYTEPTKLNTAAMNFAVTKDGGVTWSAVKTLAQVNAAQTWYQNSHPAISTDGQWILFCTTEQLSTNLCATGIYLHRYNVLTDTLQSPWSIAYVGGKSTGDTAPPVGNLTAWNWWNGQWVCANPWPGGGSCPWGQTQEFSFISNDGAFTETDFGGGLAKHGDHGSWWSNAEIKALDNVGFVVLGGGSNTAPGASHLGWTGTVQNNWGAATAGTSYGGAIAPSGKTVNVWHQTSSNVHIFFTTNLGATFTDTNTGSINDYFITQHPTDPENKVLAYQSAAFNGGGANTINERNFNDLSFIRQVVALTLGVTVNNFKIQAGHSPILPL